jgi:6-phosphogluconolactonase
VMSDVEIHVVDDPAQAVAELLVQAAGDVVLTGGSTPKRAYELAARRQDWVGVTFWWGDERCVPPDDERSNFGMAKAALLDRVERPPEIRRIQGELDPEEAARLYDAELQGVTLDLLLLGIGPDGHTASLFPNAPSLDEAERLAVAAEAGFEPYVPRVTLTLPAIAAALEVVFLVTGEEKAEPVERAFGRPPSKDTPASLARGRRTVAYLDGTAASRLRR